MDNIKRKIGIALIVVITISCICIIALFALQGKSTEIKENNDNNEVVEGDTEVVYTSQKLRDPTKFYSIEACIQENIDKDFIAKDMNILEGDTIFNYAVYGIDKNNKEKYFIVRTDIENMTFLIEELEDKYSDISQINLETDRKEIRDNGKNIFEYIAMISDEQMCRIYLEQFLKLELENTEEAYQLLEEEYKKERFPTYKDYQEYVEENQEIIQESVLSKYSVEHYDDYTQYVLVDVYNNTYTLNATSVMTYTIKLDNYTIKVDDYANNYKKLSNENKVQSNVYIFLQMINTKDYKHAYELLDETFKKNNFSTIEQFKEYVKNNFFAYNLNISSEISIKEEGNYYIYETTIRSNSGSAAETRKLTVIMKLKEETDFVMSFSIE